MILVQDMLNKDRKIRDFTEFRKSMALSQGAATTSMRNYPGGVAISKS